MSDMSLIAFGFCLIWIISKNAVFFFDFLEFVCCRNWRCVWTIKYVYTKLSVFLNFCDPLYDHIIFVVSVLYIPHYIHYMVFHMKHPIVLFDWKQIQFKQPIYTYMINKPFKESEMNYIPFCMLYFNNASIIPKHLVFIAWLLIFISYGSGFHLLGINIFVYFAFK